MTSEVRLNASEPEQVPDNEVSLGNRRPVDLETCTYRNTRLLPRFQGTVVTTGGVFSSVLRGLFWPFGIVVRVAAHVSPYLRCLAS